MPRIDSHHHLWDQAVRPQSWMTPELHARIGGPYGDADWAAEASAAGVDYGVFVQTVAVAEETPEVLALAAGHPDLVGVVGWIDYDGDAASDLDALRDGPGGERLVGVRAQAEAFDDVDWLAGPDVAAIAAALGARDLSLDLQTAPSMLAAAARLAARTETRLVVDHLSKPTMREEDFAAWADGIRSLARYPHVACKLSGFLTFDGEPMTAARLQPYVDVVLEAFGPQRLMYGSDWPVSVLGGGYGETVRIADAVIAGVSPAEQEHIWWHSARTWYPAIAGAIEGGGS